MQNNYQLLPDQADLQTHKKIHQAVLENSRWFGDEPPIMDEKFNAAQTDERRELFLEILRRAARQESNVGLSRAYTALADKLDFCGDEKCGSSACPTCRRAYQRASSAAQTEIIQQLSDLIPGKGLVFVTVGHLVRVTRDCHYTLDGDDLTTVRSENVTNVDSCIG